MKKIFTAVLVFLMLTAVPAYADIVPLPDGSSCYDELGILSEEDKEEINSTSKSLKEEYGREIAVAAVKDFFGYADEHEYARDFMDTWEVGGLIEQNGILILYVSDGEFIIETGEAVKEDFNSYDIRALMRRINPMLEKNDIRGAIMDAYGFLAARTSNGKYGLKSSENKTEAPDSESVSSAESTAQEEEDDALEMMNGLIVLGVMVIIFIGAVLLINRKRKNNPKYSSCRDERRRNSDWSSSSGSSSSSSSSGGYSGGGGSSGGGGASGGW